MVRNLRIRFEALSIKFILDLHEYLEGPGDLYGTGIHPITKEGLPRTFGHEFAGTLARRMQVNHSGKNLEVGTTVTDLKVGDDVGICPLIYDGTCSRCLAGHPNLCENLGFHGN